MMVMEVTTPIDYHPQENTLFLFDRHNNRMLSYPLQTHTTAILPDTSYPVRIKSQVSWFRYISPDSLLLYEYERSRLHYYSIPAQKIYKDLAFINRSAFPAPAGAAPPFTSAAAPLFFLGDKIIGAGSLLGEKEKENPAYRTICAVVDVKTGAPQYKVPYSRVYQEHNWGGAHLRTPYTTYHPSTKEMVLSLPADHHLLVIDSNWQVREVPAAGRTPVCITSMPLTKGNKKMLDADYALDYYIHTPSYSSIIYDPYHDRYYRLLELPPATPKADNGKPQGKTVRLIAFDSSFTYLGEAALPAALVPDNFFVTPAGVYFLNARNKDQNIAQYVQCKIEG